ncbi:MAG: DUF637 domain-containing protein, partial [Pseudomonadales bacterium]|nr:DUF637 domain-containing protein [Pseudomonadales bacterium]
NERTFGGTANFQNVELINATIGCERDLFLNVQNDLTIVNGGSTECDGNTNISVGGQLSLQSGHIKSVGDIKIQAHSVEAATVVHRYDYGYEQGGTYGEVTKIDSAVGEVVVRSASDIILQGVSVDAGESITFAANGNIFLGSQQNVIQGDYRGRWKGSYTNVDYLQTTLTAEETIKLIANGQIVIDAAEIVSSRGHLEVLAGMGITIESDLASEQFSRKGKFGKKKVTESAYQTVAIRALLDAGKGVRLHTEFGDITLRSADISTNEGASVRATHGGVNLLMTTETDHYSYSSVKEGTFTVTTKNKGHIKETGVPNTIVGGLEVEALSSVVVEYKGDDNKTLDEQISKLSGFEGLEWMSEVRNDPSLDVDWNAVDYEYKKWRESNTSLNAAAMALVVVVVSIVTAGAGATVAGAAGTAAGTTGTSVLATAVNSSFMQAAISAGTASLISQASVALVNGAVNGDIGGAIEDFASDETLKSLAVAMVSAGAIAELDAAFFDVDSEAVSNLPTDGSATSEVVQVAGDSATQSLQMQVAEALTHATVNAGVETLIQGGDFEEVFVHSLLMDATNRIGKEFANEIGDAKKLNQIDKAQQYMAHAALGCSIGVAKAAIQDGDTDAANGCASGAGGAVIGEYVAQKIREDFFNEVNELRANQELSVSEMKVMYDEYNAHGVDMARLSAALTAFALGGDVTIASDAGQNAAENNAFWFVVIPVFIALEKAWTIYEYAQWSLELGEAIRTNNQTEVERLLKDKATDLGVDIVVSSIPGGKLLKEIAEKFKSKYPGASEVFEDLLDYANHQSTGTTASIVPGKNSVDLPEPKVEHHIGPSTPIKPSQHTLSEQREALDKVKNGEEVLDSTKRKGNFGEMAVDDDMVNKGFTPLHERIKSLDAPTTQGIDGIFEKDGKFYIVESKFGSSRLSKGLADGTDQMDAKWIENRIEQLNLPVEVKLDILDNYLPVVARIDEAGAIAYKKLDDTGRVVLGNAGKIPEL